MKCLKKLLLLFLLFCTFMFCIPVLSNNAFASVSYKNWEKETVELPDLPVVEGCGNYIIAQNKSQPNYIWVYFFPDDLSFYPVVRKENNNLGLCKKDSYAFADSGTVTFYLFNVKDNKYYAQNKTSGGIGDATNTYVYDCTTDIYYQEKDGTLTNDLYFQAITSKKNPYFVNSLDNLLTWKFDNLYIDYGDYDINQTIYLHICKRTVDVSGASSFYYTDSVIALSANGKYYESYEDGQVYYFSIPKDNLPFTVSAGDKIIFYLSSSANNLGGAYSSDEPLKDSSILDTKTFTVGTSYTDEDKQKDYQDKISSSLEDQKQAIEENTKTNKNIFEKIGDILSYINPFSENFFGKKLVELILDGLKGLFVPEEGFFDTYFSDLKNWFSDRLGFLWTPFDIIIEILNKILNINFSEPIFHIPEINEPFSGSKLISEYDYNLNSLLDNDIFKNIHDIYFIGVDAVIIFALINLARRKIEEVFSN